MDSGKVNKEILCKNLDAAIDVYISCVDKAPCARTEIHLMKGAHDEDNQKEQEIQVMFLKDTKNAKEKAKLKEPDLYNQIERIWHEITNIVSAYHKLYFQMWGEVRFDLGDRVRSIQDGRHFS